MRNALIVLSCLATPGLALAQNSAPVADAGEDQTILVGEYTTLNGSATDPDGQPIAAWLWSVDSAPDGGVPEILYPDMVQPLFRADVPGNYVLSLIASDGIAWGEADFTTIHVHEILPPEATIYLDTTAGPAPLTVHFDGSGSFVDPFAQPATYFWNFGDSSLSSEVSPTHTFEQAGTFTVVFVVTDALGASDQDSIDVVVVAGNTPPEASPTATPNSGTAPLVTEFHANASDADGDDLIYLWNFGDPDSLDNTSTLANPGHVFEAPGTYSVWLTVSDGTDDVSEHLSVVVAAGQALSTRKASVVKWVIGKAAKGTISYWADIDLPVPAADDVISFTFDGVKLFNKPFGAFRPGLEPGVYLLIKRDLLVRMNFNTNRVYVLKRKVNLKKFDNSDGVDIELFWGDDTAVDQFVMTQVTDSVWSYARDEPL